MSEKYKDLKDISDNWLNEILSSRRTDVPSTVYHYTDAAGLHGMLKNGTVWATDFRFLNDRTEIVHYHNVVSDYILPIIASGEDSSEKQVYSALKRYMSLDTPFDQYVFSLSSEKDDLSQWRGYAREGKGFTLGFSGLELLNVTAGPSNPFAFVKVNYSQEAQISRFKNATLDLLRQVKVELEKEDADKDDVHDETGRFLDAIVSANAAISKHRSFASENEWRLVALPSKNKRQRRKTRVSGQRIIPYVELSLSSDGDTKLPLTSIGIGPGFSGAEDVYAVEALCEEMGYKPEIYSADTPYRRLS